MSARQVLSHVFMVEHHDYVAGRGTVDTWGPEVWPCKVDENDERVYIGEQTITIDIPDDFDPVPGQVAALRQKQAEALEKYQRTVAEINERLQKLLAIENKPVEAAQ